MKKTIALVMALLMAMSFVACGNKEPEPLPVKFGNVTNIEITGDNSEAIVLTMDEPSSSQGAERDVYISAVDYIFTHASKALEELSVTAYGPDGNKIIGFTMPSYLITSLREVEAQGSWGTQGFAAFYYFNSEAYDVLVASCIYPEGKNETQEPVTEATETTEDVLETTSNEDVDYDMVALFLESTGSQWDYWDVYVDDGVFVINFAMDGMGQGVAQFRNAGYDANHSEWVAIKDTMLTMFQSNVELMKTVGVENPNCYLNFVNDQNHDEIFVTIYNGEVTYDIMAE